MGAEKDAVEVDGKDLPPLGERQLLERTMWVDAGVVDEDVDPAVGVQHGRDGART